MVDLEFGLSILKTHKLVPDVFQEWFEIWTLANSQDWWITVRHIVNHVHKILHCQSFSFQMISHFGPELQVIDEFRAMLIKDSIQTFFSKNSKWKFDVGIIWKSFWDKILERWALCFESCDFKADWIIVIKRNRIINLSMNICIITYSILDPVELSKTSLPVSTNRLESFKMALSKILDTAPKHRLKSVQSLILPRKSLSITHYTFLKHLFQSLLAYLFWGILISWPKLKVEEVHVINSMIFNHVI